jgi:hypothetical protein
MSNRLKALFVVKPHGLVSTESGELVNYVVTIYKRNLATNFSVYYISTHMFFPNTGDTEEDEKVFLMEQKNLVSGYLRRLRTILGHHPIDVLDLRKSKVDESTYPEIVKAWNDSCKRED